MRINRTGHYITLCARPLSGLALPGGVAVIARAGGGVMTAVTDAAKPRTSP